MRASARSTRRRTARPPCRWNSATSSPVKEFGAAKNSASASSIGASLPSKSRRNVATRGGGNRDWSAARRRCAPRRPTRARSPRRHGRARWRGHRWCRRMRSSRGTIHDDARRSSRQAMQFRLLLVIPAERSGPDPPFAWRAPFRLQRRITAPAQGRDDDEYSGDDHSLLPGLARQSRVASARRWITGSSPVMTGLRQRSERALLRAVFRQLVRRLQHQAPHAAALIRWVCRISSASSMLL